MELLINSSSNSWEILSKIAITIVPKMSIAIVISILLISSVSVVLVFYKLSSAIGLRRVCPSCVFCYFTITFRELFWQMLIFFFNYILGQRCNWVWQGEKEAEEGEEEKEKQRRQGLEFFHALIMKVPINMKICFAF